LDFFQYWSWHAYTSTYSYAFEYYCIQVEETDDFISAENYYDCIKFLFFNVSMETTYLSLGKYIYISFYEMEGHLEHIKLCFVHMLCILCTNPLKLSFFFLNKRRNLTPFCKILDATLDSEYLFITRCLLCIRPINAVSWIFIVLFHWNSDLKVDMLLYLDTLSYTMPTHFTPTL